VDPVVGAAVATVSRTLDVPGGRAVQLQYPRSMPEEFVQRTLIPAVEGGVRTLASMTAAVHRAVVTTYLENKLRIAYLAWDARVLHQDVIPILATVHAHQLGRDQLGTMWLDADLEEAARVALDAKRRRRLGY
jgi:hypothetical protein